LPLVPNFSFFIQFESTGKVIALSENQVILEKTIFHPQGGGQPMDYGTISSKDGSTSFKISDLKCQGDAIIHVGSFTAGSKFSEGEEVLCKIDGDFRKQNARIHSAGHLLDVAMNRAGRTDLKPGKGYHFVEGPYVEYIGVVPEKEREPLIADLNKHCAALIKEANDAKAKVYRKMCSYNEANEELKGAGGCPQYCESGKEVRVLKLIPEDLGCPCGGTHVHEIGEIGEIVVLKMKKKKQNT